MDTFCLSFCFRFFFDLHAWVVKGVFVHVVSFPSVEATENVDGTVEVDGLMESSSSRGVSTCYDSLPSWCEEVKLMKIIKSLLKLVNTSKHKHRSSIRNCRVSVPPFDLPRGHQFLPNPSVKIILKQIIQSRNPIPPPKNIHRIIHFHRSMSKSKFWFLNIRRDLLPIRSGNVKSV